MDELFDGSVSKITYIPPEELNFLFEKQQSELIEELNRLEFQESVVPGRSHLWFDTYNRPYAFSKHNLQGKNFPNKLQELTNEINKYFNEKFESVLLNKYNSLSTGLGWHSDNEKYIPPNPTIISVSLGCARNFEIRRMKESEREWECSKTGEVFVPNNEWEMEAHRFLLSSGSIIIMEGSFQRYWYHQVPKYKNQHDDNVRYNLTFRPYV